MKTTAVDAKSTKCHNPSTPLLGEREKTSKLKLGSYDRRRGYYVAPMEQDQHVGIMIPGDSRRNQPQIATSFYWS